MHVPLSQLEASMLAVQYRRGCMKGATQCRAGRERGPITSLIHGPSVG